MNRIESSRPKHLTRPRRRALRWAVPLAGVVLGVGIAGPLAAQEPAFGSHVQGLLEVARAQNPELAAMRQEADAAAQRVQPAGALPDPLLRIELMNMREWVNEASPTPLPWRVGETRYTLMQMLPGWGKRDLKRDAAAADAQQARARGASTWAELALRIKTTFAESYRAAGSARLIREVLDLMARLEQIAQARYAGGLAVQQDAIRAQLEQTAMRAELIALENERQQLRARLNALLARDAAAPLAEPLGLRALPALTPADAAALAQQARTNNPALQVEQARLEAAQKSRDLAFRNRGPDFQIGVSPTQLRSRITSWGLMFEMNIPLQQETRRSQEQEAQAMVGAAQSRTQALSNQLLGELAGQLAAFDTARRTEALLTTQLLPQSDVSLQSALAAYESGKADFATLLDAQRQIRKAKQDLLKAQVDAQMRLAEIESILGAEL